jgi:hypothetical protein
MKRPSLQKVIAGDKLDSIPAGTWNGFIDAANFVRNLTLSDTANLAPQVATGGAIVPIYNNSGSTRRRFEILGIDGLKITQSDNANWPQAPVLIGTTPTISSGHTRKFALLQEPIASGKIGLALIDGVSPCKLKIQDAGDDFADALDTDGTQLVTGSYGAAQILYKESGTGTGKWAYVRVGTGTMFALGKTNAAINKGASGQVNLYRGTKGSESATGDNLASVWNRFANVASGKWVICAYFLGGWDLIAAEC